MKSRTHLQTKHFEEINWLPVKNRVDQCIAVTAYNYKKNFSPPYMSEIYINNDSPTINTRRSLNSLKQPNYIKNCSRNALSYIGPKLWNDLDQGVKISCSTNSFKHALKKSFFNELKSREKGIYR